MGELVIKTISIVDGHRMKLSAMSLVVTIKDAPLHQLGGNLIGGRENINRSI